MGSYDFVANLSPSDLGVLMGFGAIIDAMVIAGVVAAIKCFIDGRKSR